MGSEMCIRDRSDDALSVTTASDGIHLTSAFWDEDGAQRTCVSRAVILVVIDDGSLVEGERASEILGSDAMLLAQFVVGIYCSDQTFDSGIQALDRLLANTEVMKLTPRPDAQTLEELLAEFQARMRREQRV